VYWYIKFDQLEEEVLYLREQLTEEQQKKDKWKNKCKENKINFQEQNKEQTRRFWSNN